MTNSSFTEESKTLSESSINFEFQELFDDLDLPEDVWELGQKKLDHVNKIRNFEKEISFKLIHIIFPNALRPPFNMTSIVQLIEFLERTTVTETSKARTFWFKLSYEERFSVTNRVKLLEEKFPSIKSSFKTIKEFWPIENDLEFPHFDNLEEALEYFRNFDHSFSYELEICESISNQFDDLLKEMNEKYPFILME